MLHEEIHPQKQKKYESKKYYQPYHCCLRRSKIPQRAKAPMKQAIMPKKINTPITLLLLQIMFFFHLYSISFGKVSNFINTLLYFPVK